MLNKKSASLWLMALMYLTAFAVGFLVYGWCDAFFTGFWPMLAADAAATIVVWLFGLAVKNASAYDPYWSVAPAVMAGAWMLMAEKLGTAQVLLLSALVIWGVRLTANFVTGWTGFAHQDWRYGMLKEKNPKLWWVTNLMGINLFPTLIVFACMIPAYYIVEYGDRVTMLGVLGLLMCLTAVFFQMTADAEMRKFRAGKKPGEHIETGLWRLSRHPNYFGEVLFWWGVWVMQMGAVPEIWMTAMAPVAMTGMFIFISIPMMETHIAEKCPAYADYQKRVSMLVPMPAEKIRQPE